MDLDLHAEEPGYSVAIIKPLKVFELKNDRYFLKNTSQGEW